MGKRLRTYVPGYVLAGSVALGGVGQALDSDWWAAFHFAVLAAYIAMAVHLSERSRVAHYRSGYAYGVLAVLEVDLHLARTGERRPIPPPDQVHPDDPIEVPR